MTYYVIVFYKKKLSKKQEIQEQWQKREVN